MNFLHLLLPVVQRAALLEALSKVQLQPQYLSQLTSITSIQTRGLKKHFLEQEKVDNKITRKRRNDKNEEEVQIINSISGSRKRKRLLMMGTEVNKTSEGKDPNVVGFEVRLFFKQSLKHICFYGKVITLIDCFMVLCFMASSAVHAEKSVHYLLIVGGSYKL